ncbi:4-hydroxy-2-oxovalerate aldolase [Pradoshia sp.]
MRDVHVLDVSLRDGSHSMKHAFTVEQVKSIARGLDRANIEYFEVAHGDGLGGSSLQYGLSAVDELKLIEAAAAECIKAKIAVLLIPGIGVKDNLKEAVNAGAKMARIATHVTEADIGAQHIAMSRELGLKTAGFLMMAHMAPVERIVKQAQLFESYGAEIVYVTDSAGYLLPHQVTERIKALKESVGIEIGFHAHNNLSLAMANSLAAIEAGATYIDGSLRALGAGSGNTQTEALIAVLQRLGIQTGVDLYNIIDVANQIVAPILPRPQEISGSSLIMGYAGVYSSFLLHTEKAARQFGVDERDILIELGERKTVGGQEDLIYEVAQELMLSK